MEILKTQEFKNTNNNAYKHHNNMNRLDVVFSDLSDLLSNMYNHKPVKDLQNVGPFNDSCVTPDNGIANSNVIATGDVERADDDTDHDAHRKILLLDRTADHSLQSIEYLLREDVNKVTNRAFFSGD